MYFQGPIWNMQVCVVAATGPPLKEQLVRRVTLRLYCSISVIEILIGPMAHASAVFGQMLISVRQAGVELGQPGPTEQAGAHAGGFIFDN